jgi:hypothetical protein
MSSELYEQPLGDGPTAEPARPKRKPRVPPERVKCEYCSTEVRGGTGLRLHHQSQSCLAMKSRKSIPKDWVMVDYTIRDVIYQATNNWNDYTKYNPATVRNFLYSYSRPGWGRNGRNHRQQYMHPKLAVIILSPHISVDEKLISLHRDPESPEFLAAYATAELTR